MKDKGNNGPDKGLHTVGDKLVGTRPALAQQLLAHCNDQKGNRIVAGGHIMGG